MVTAKTRPYLHAFKNCKQLCHFERKSIPQHSLCYLSITCYHKLFIIHVLDHAIITLKLLEIFFKTYLGFTNCKTGLCILIIIVNTKLLPEINQA